MRYLPLCAVLALSGCVVAPGGDPYPAYYGGYAYDNHPYAYYNGAIGAYPVHRDFHHHYNWGSFGGEHHAAMGHGGPAHGGEHEH